MHVNALAGQSPALYNTHMQDFIHNYESFSGWLKDDPFVLNILASLFYLIGGLVAKYVLRQVFKKIRRYHRIPLQVALLLEKTLAAGILFITLSLILSAFGINIASILGAAGVMGIAVGFASQTALSNVICGVFLVSERSVKIGDFIKVSDNEGTVESINLLSVLLRQPDNSLVRIPNQNLIQNPVVNITGSLRRRCDFIIGVDYSSDLHHVRNVLMDVIRMETKLLDDPAPVISFIAFADSSLNIKIGAWCNTTDYFDARYNFAASILKRFNEEDINIPFPCRTLFMQQTGSKELDLGSMSPSKQDTA